MEEMDEVTVESDLSEIPSGVAWLKLQLFSWKLYTFLLIC